MRAFLTAAIAALTFGLVATDANASNWRDQILGITSAKPQARAPISRQRSRTATSRKTTRRGAKRRYSSLGARKARNRRIRRSYSGRTLRGLASYYWQPQRVASGGWFNPNALTAAHKSLPFGTRVRVTNLRNGRSVVVRINDRGPYIRGRIIDLSRRAASIVRMRGAGVVPVRVDVL